MLAAPNRSTQENENLFSHLHFKPSHSLTCLKFIISGPKIEILAENRKEICTSKADTNMVFPVGVSIGDFITGITLICNCIKALDNVKGASSEYIQLSSTLDALSVALTEFDGLNLLASHASQQQAIKKTVDGCRSCINTFLRRIDKYGSLKSKSRSQWSLSAMKTGITKINWSLSTKSDISKFQANVSTHINAIQIVLSTIKM
jgi:hypothetical protein